MRQHWKFWVRSVIFAAILVVLLVEVNRILTPKFYYDNQWPTTSGYKGFYRMPENSVDVLFLGSSHAASAFNPQIFFNEYGIKSYNLGCEQQSLLTSYYWLREALRFQSPKAVILDTYMVFPYIENEPLNSEESCTRKAFDCMKWSGVKYDAVQDICRYDQSQSLSSYFFPNIRYHTRWTNLTEDDFTFAEKEEHYELKGYVPFAEYGSNINYLPFKTGNLNDRAEMFPLMQEYLDKIVDLCASEGIMLILVKTPATSESVAMYNALSDYADQKGISFMDFNEEGLFYECGFDFAENMKDNWHSNIWGAEKLSSYMASVLYGRLETYSHDFSEEWEDTDSYYQNILHDCSMTHIMDICAYLEAVRQERYTILIAGRKDLSGLPDEVLQKFRELGLEMDYGTTDSYFASIHEGMIEEESSPERLVCYGSTRNRRTDYCIVSAGGISGTQDMASILIDNEEYAKNGIGINLVVYSNDTGKVVDSVCYNGDLLR